MDPHSHHSSTSRGPRFISDRPIKSCDTAKGTVSPGENCSSSLLPRELSPLLGTQRCVKCAFRGEPLSAGVTIFVTKYHKHIITVQLDMFSKSSYAQNR